jgi:hypothetical protein
MVSPSATHQSLTPRAGWTGRGPQLVGAQAKEREEARSGLERVGDRPPAVQEHPGLDPAAYLGHQDRSVRRVGAVTLSQAPQGPGVRGIGKPDHDRVGASGHSGALRS